MPRRVSIPAAAEHTQRWRCPSGPVQLPRQDSRYPRLVIVAHRRQALERVHTTDPTEWEVFIVEERGDQSRPLPVLRSLLYRRTGRVRGKDDRGHSALDARDGFGEVRSRILSGRKPDHISPSAVSTTGARIHPAALSRSRASALALRSISVKGMPHLFRVRLVASHCTQSGFV